MNAEQWERLLAVVEGETLDSMPVGFIIDSPWLAGWAGQTMLDYFVSERKWMEANWRAIRAFPEAMFLPGFWAEYGMCTEPSAFGAKCSWFDGEMPFACEIAASCEEAAALAKPNPKTDGLAPFVLARLRQCRGEIEAEGHAIRFAVARGPLNVATFLMGNTEFLMGMMTEPDKIHAMLRTVTDYLVDWLRLQAETFETIEGVFVLDDIVGFLGEREFLEFAKPYLKDVFEAVEARVRFFHNDAEGLVCAPHLADVGVNLFNYAFKHDIAEMRDLAGERVALLGGIPPRDVLAQGTPAEVRASVRAQLGALGSDRRRVILSCGGGMPPGAPAENIAAFLEAAREAR